MEKYARVRINGDSMDFFKERQGGKPKAEYLGRGKQSIIINAKRADMSALFYFY